MGYRGKAGKHSFYESYRREEERNKRVESFFAGLESAEQYKLERKAEREKPHSLKVGEIIHHSWEGTNASRFLPDPASYSARCRNPGSPGRNRSWFRRYDVRQTHRG